MRITNEMLSDTVLRNLDRNLRAMDRVQSELSSGKRIAHPSDDPRAIGTALTLRSALSNVDAHLKALDSGLAWMNATDATLDSATQLMQRARELAVEGSTDSTTPSQMGEMAAEVDQILNEMVGLGNSSGGGQRLFGGFQTTNASFTLVSGPPTTVTYNGDSGQMTREIDVGSTISINVPGNGPFLPVMNALIRLRDDLQAGNTTAVRGDIGTVDSSVDGLLATRADIGGRVNRLEAVQDRQKLLQTQLTEQLSKVEDTDLTEAITRFSAQETVYKAALAAGAQALQPSLFDYLR